MKVTLLLQNPKMLCGPHSSPWVHKSPAYSLNQNNPKEHEAYLYSRETLEYKIISSFIKSPTVGKDVSLIKQMVNSFGTLEMNLKVGLNFLN